MYSAAFIPWRQARHLPIDAAGPAPSRRRAAGQARRQWVLFLRASFLRGRAAVHCGPGSPGRRPQTDRFAPVAWGGPPSRRVWLLISRPPARASPAWKLLAAGAAPEAAHPPWRRGAGPPQLEPARTFRRRLRSFLRFRESPLFPWHGERFWLLLCPVSARIEAVFIRSRPFLTREQERQLAVELHAADVATQAARPPWRPGGVAVEPAPPSTAGAGAPPPV
mmetsp:Transcript_57681/g.149921  ORF Transcript_57681/g.149921 Transcript_57681/m.149921 type:complete len:222 (+) Transcript_57681:169-834(+)